MEILFGRETRPSRERVWSGVTFTQGACSGVWRRLQKLPEIRVNRGSSRRQLLITAAGSLGLALLPRRSRGATVPAAPVARVQPVKDVYFGETVTDPYRWMENAKDPDWLPFLEGQNAHTRAILDALPERKGLLKRTQQLSGDAASTRDLQQAGARLFFEQRPVGADNYKLFVHEAGRVRVLVDPTRMGGAFGHVSMDWWRASPDGDHVAYGLSENGGENSILHILKVADGRNLPERIANTQGCTPQWLDDGSGFFYSPLTGALGTPWRYRDEQSRFHRLGADPAADPILVQRGLAPRVPFEASQNPTIFTHFGSDHVVLFLKDIREEAMVFVAPVSAAIAGPTTWTPVATLADEVTAVGIQGGDLYLLSYRDAPRGRILKTPLAAPDIASATEILPQSERVIEDFTRARDGFYVKFLDGGVGRLARLTSKGAFTEISLPFDGTIRRLVTNPAHDGALLIVTGWLSPEGLWSVSANGKVADTGLAPRPAIDVSRYATTRAFAIAKDGAKIPYTLIHRKDLVRDGRTPALIWVYGALGVSLSPTFAGRTLALIDAGFIVGYAAVRGGGELGREWHDAGKLANKPNSWRDLIVVCETLCAEHYTSPERLAIAGRSAGGVTVGRAMTERPDLFAAVIDGVGWSNPLRYVVEQNGYGEESEWGDIADEAGYRDLKAIDSYQAVRDGTPYPAVLLTTGVNDPRNAPFHVAKMTARLQAATSSERPVLLRVDFDAGHGVGSTRAQQDREAADIYTFLVWQTNTKGHGRI